MVDLNDSALKPEGWDGLTMPHAQKTKADLAKMTIHESHIRDLSAWDQTVPAELRGKYLALTARGKQYGPASETAVGLGRDPY